MTYGPNATIDRDVPMPSSIPKEKIISDDVQKSIEIALFVVVAGTVALFGTFANMANIIVFSKQSLQESATVFLLSLSVSDFGISLTTIGSAVTNALGKANLDLPVDLQSFGYIVFSIPRGGFNDISLFTIVFLSVERCLCVVKPLTFKNILTRRRTMMTLTTLYSWVIILHALLLYSNRLIWKYNKGLNATRLQLETTPMGTAVLAFYKLVNGVSVPFISMGIVLISSLVMIYGLKKASQFRMQTTVPQKDGKSPSPLQPKDLKLIKMVVYLSAMFIISYIPYTTLYAVRAVMPEVNFYQQYHNLNQTFWGVIYSAVAINAAGNVFVYYRMSSKYREIFLRIVHGCFPRPK